jgi:penicillin amidase
MKPRARWWKRLAWFILLLLLSVALGAYLLLRQSLPQLDGERAVGGLADTATITRDAQGTVTVQAALREDALRALGFVHAQERFFEMDLMRRAAAGELSELFGRAALPLDRKNRVHRFRHRAAAVLAAATTQHRAGIDAYVEGVNAGLHALAARPFPYLLLRQQPRDWSATDCVLVIDAMFLDLNSGGGNERELALMRMHAALPPSLYALLNAPGTDWDAPLRGDAYATPPLPTVDEVDLRKLDRALFGKQVALGGDLGIGSNNFGVSGALTETGAALIANDMHLGLGVPNIWFRARIRYERDTLGRGPVDLIGATLPGVPGLVAGSNGHIAWAYTNSYGDWLDWVRVPWLDAERTRYRGTHGEANIERIEERIAIAGDESETLTFAMSEFGPVLAEENEQTGLALDWIAYHPRGLNFEIYDLAHAQDVTQALAIAQRAGMPPQNFTVGDANGALAWTIIGAIPERGAFDPLLPHTRDAEHPGWLGWLPPERYPLVMAPESGRIWTANARTMDGDALAAIGDGGYALGARARQIRDGLFARERFAPADMLAIQLDDRTLFLERWWRLLRDTLAHNNDPALAELSRLTQTWDQRASTDAVSYRLVRAFRLAVSQAVVDGLFAPMRAHDAEFVAPALSQVEGAVWRLLQERPAHLLAPIYTDWDALLVRAAHQVVEELGSQPGGLAARNWGERNTTRIRHPLSRAIGALGWLLDMPARALPGDTAMPRVQAPAFGSSERFAVSPGHEDQGYFHMPGGQSGHPLSPFYGAGHRDWEEGTPSPFLPGPTVHTLRLTPANAR